MGCKEIIKNKLANLPKRFNRNIMGCKGVIIIAYNKILRLDLIGT